MTGTKTGGLIFISCGQVTNAEKALGKQVCDLVRQLTPHEPYFAENQNSLEALTNNILGSLDDAVGLIAIMHPRGVVTFPDNRHEVRGSVWIEQEIAIAAYTTQILRRPLKIAPYIHRSVRREGMRDQLLLNAVPFTDDSEVLRHLRDVLPSWKDLPASLKITSLPKVRVALKRGHVSNFLIEYSNDEDEPIFIREARLFGGKNGKIELTEPLTPDDPSTWRVAPHCSATFGKTIVCQRDPAASLVRMNSNKGIFFHTEIVVVASCEMRGQLSEVRHTLYVKVNATKPEIVPLV
jgi:hypothetical protein